VAQVVECLTSKSEPEFKPLPPKKKKIPNRLRKSGQKMEVHILLKLPFYIEHLH
jgi:hypothetical protein